MTTLGALPAPAGVDTALLARARGLASLIELEADVAERATTTTAKVVDALRQSELFWSLVPSELGGLATDVSPHLRSSRS